MNTNTNTNTNAVPAIAFKRILHSNERCLVYDLHVAMVKGDTATALTLVKSWLALQGGKDFIPADRDVVKLYDEMTMVFWTGKNATVKGTKEASLNAMSQGKLKAWLHTFKRGNVAIVDKYADKERPEEKQARARKAKSYKVDAADFEAYKAWKAAMAKAE